MRYRLGAAFAVAFAASATPALANVEVGLLECRGASQQFIVGSVTKFGTEQSNKSFSGGGYGSAFGLGQVGTSKGKANVAITARIIDTTTGEIMASAKGDGTSKRSGLLLGGAGGGGGGGGGGQVAIGSSQFHDTILGEATEAAVKATTDKLVAAKSRLQ